MSDIKNVVIKAFFWLFSGRIIQHIVTLVTLPILARILTPEDFGLMAAAMLVIEFSSTVSMLGLSPSLIQRQDLEKGHIQTANTVAIILGGGFAILLLLFAEPIQTFFDIEGVANILSIMAVVFLFQGIGMTSTALMQREMRFREISFIPWTTKIIYAIVAISSALAGMGVMSLVFGRLAMIFTNNLIYFYLSPVWPTFRFSRSAFNDLFYFSSGMSLTQIVNYFGRQGDFLIVGKFMDSFSLGIYTKAYSLMNLPVSFIGQILNNILFPALSKLQEDTEKVTRIFTKTLLGLMMFGFPITGICVILADEIVMTLLGPQWGEAVPLFQILSFGMFFRLSYKVGNSVITSRGKPYRILFIQIIFLILVFTTVFLAVGLGLIAVAYAMLFCLVIMYFMMTFVSMRLIQYPMRKFLLLHIRPVVIVTFITLITLGVKQVLWHLHLSDFLTIIICAVFYAIFWVVVFVKFPRALGESAYDVIDNLLVSIRIRYKQAV